ncbi:self-incompatibility protein S1-like [Ziziphus jujuba]|uniref:S-protein homolog n=1 Tax=Ziziphus jujuba TaxID=326968 RepID=A0ABM3ID62_ZIZJJ|nr:self-incompatibility protein S1-like [Ziziphus jujuba]
MKLSNTSYVVVLALGLCMSQTQALFDSTTVHIFNGLKNESLEAHCQSKDDDLVIEQIEVGGDFNWHFRTNFFKTTLFFCNLKWFLYHYCDHKHRRWRRKEDGICFLDYDYQGYRFVYDWEH